MKILQSIEREAHMCAVLGKYEKKLSLLDASKIQKYISRGFAYFSHTFCIQSSH